MKTILLLFVEAGGCIEAFHWATVGRELESKATRCRIILHRVGVCLQ
jgi:hypothetical protein